MDKPIQRKSKTYVESEVNSGRADWVDPLDPRKGIVCREMLHFGDRKFVSEESAGNGGFMPGLKFIPPKMEKNPLIAHVETYPIFTAARNWDWSVEAEAMGGQSLDGISREYAPAV